VWLLPASVQHRFGYEITGSGILSDEDKFRHPAYNEEKMIGACIATIQKGSCARSSRAEIVVVNNASTTVREGRSAITGVRVVDEQKKGTRVPGKQLSCLLW